MNDGNVWNKYIPFLKERRKQSMKIKKMINQITISMLCISIGIGNMVPVYAAITENDASTFGETENNSISKKQRSYTRRALLIL